MLEASWMGSIRSTECGGKNLELSLQLALSLAD